MIPLCFMPILRNMENQEMEYLNPWTGVDMKAYNRVGRSLMTLMALTPLQIVAIGIGVYQGFQHNDGTFLTYAIALSLVLTLIRTVFYEKVSESYDIIAKDTNLKMWNNINENVNKRYGGTVIPYDDEPAKVIPPDGANTFGAKINRIFIGKLAPVVFVDENGEHEHKQLNVAVKTFEPQLTNRKTPKKK